MHLLTYMDWRCPQMEYQVNNGSLNQYLQPSESPVDNSNTKFVNPVDWDILHGRDTVRAMHIQSLSFSNLTGGTAILGGVANGNGLLTVNNAGGTQVVRLDNTGIVI